ncbi:MAG: hypothetical protein ABI679_06865 [Gemmatimonadota bacterium]
MSDSSILVVVWMAVITHVIAGIVAGRRMTAFPVVPLVNLVVALCVLAYWVQRWYGYIVKGITWYATDQLLPLLAILAAVLSVLSLTGRFHNAWPQWIIFGVDLFVLLGAALFFMSFRINRLF